MEIKILDQRSKKFEKNLKHIDRLCLITWQTEKIDNSLKIVCSKSHDVIFFQNDENLESVLNGTVLNEIFLQRLLQIQDKVKKLFYNIQIYIEARKVVPLTRKIIILSQIRHKNFFFN